MTIEESNEETTSSSVVSLVAIRNKREEMQGPSNAEFLAKGIDAFVEEASKDTTGFVSIIFNAEGDPRIIWAGDIDMIRSIGAIEIAKAELFKSIHAYYPEE